MELSNTPIAQRCHIAFFGCRNAGKSSVVNAITNQEISVVSAIKGTTTDPVKKTMELLPIGPVVIIDTAGLDDVGELGALRVEKTKQVLSKTDIAILVVDSTVGLNNFDLELIETFKLQKIPYLVVFNKSDLMPEIKLGENEICVSALTGENIGLLKEKIGEFAKNNVKETFIVKDKIQEGDIVVLVIPIDESAPKGRIILPQQNTLRELLDAHCTVICCQDTELAQTLENLKKKPKVVITDSQVFGKIKDVVPKDVLLTSFSILFARYKGNLETLVRGALKISTLKDGDKVLISEACTHHRQCNDIGTVKLPNWLKNYTKKDLSFEFTSGGDFPSNLEEFSLVIHCGGCMLNEKEMQSRINTVKSANLQVVNYGVAIAYMNGILERSLEIFPEILEILKSCKNQKL